MTLTEEQINSLAPDAASLKAGRDLAVASKWVLRGASERALWGHCQGSGKLPYQTQVDLASVAFKCSCPSRKFPCKHGLGLLLLYCRQPAIFAADAEPVWLTEWLDKRTEKAEKKAEQKEKPVDAEAQAKRAEARVKKVGDGIDDLQFWIKDLLQSGLIKVPERAFEFWQQPARRMIDAQATGLATMVKGLGTINFYNDSWKYELTHRLTRIYHLSESFKYVETLPEDYSTEIKTLIGFNQTKEELMAQPGIADDWTVLSRNSSDEEQLTIEHVWLYGSRTGKFALILQFYAAAQLPELNLIPGTSVNAELVFYKGVKVFRALLKVQHSIGTSTAVKALDSLSVAYENFSAVISSMPFYERVPVIVNGISPVMQKENLYLSDKDGKAVIANCSLADKLKILSVTGGLPCTMFLQLNETDAEPLSFWVNNKFYTL